MKNKKAFTLIELLVVIAIIAILAAILFPVFAQAKAAAKASACLSNIKQQTLGDLMYTNDYDDLFPQGQVNFEGMYGYYWAQTGFIGYQFPSGNGEMDGNFEGNSAQPYIKNQQIEKCPAVSLSFNPYGYPANSEPPTSYTYNGDLHAYPTTAVTNPTLTVMHWEGLLNLSWLGRTVASPNLNCALHTQGSCMYVSNPTGALNTPGSSDFPTIFPQGNYTLPSYSKWIHNQGSNMSNTDGHAKFHHMNGGIKEDPWAYTGVNGLVYQGTLSSGTTFPVYTNAPGGHMCLFGPDNPCGL